MTFKKTRLLSLILTLSLITFCFALSSHAEFNEEENSKQISELTQENSDINDRIKKNDADITDKQEYTEKLREQISELGEKIRQTNSRLEALDSDIEQKQKEIDSLSECSKDSLTLLKKRLRTIHMAGNASSLEIILGAKSFSDLIDKSEMIKRMSEYDDTLIHSINNEIKAIAEEKSELEAKKEQLEQEKRELEEDTKRITALSDENKKLIEELRSDSDKLKNELEANKQMQKQLDEALKQYKKEQEEKAEQERKQREEEERKKAESSAENNDDENEPEIIVPHTDDRYVWPCPGFTYLTSTFEEWRGENNHGAIDIADAGIYGAQVVACYDGVVFSMNDTCEHDWGKDSSCGCGGGYGNYVMIDHGNGKISIYGHLSDVTVESGQEVRAGQLIGHVGSTGYSTGPHLHFETQYNWVRYDPMTEF